MKLTVWGGTGYAGSAIVAEARKRGHEVVVYSRTESDEKIDGVDYRTASILDAADRATSLDADVTVVAVAPRGDMAGQLRPAVAELAQQAGAAGTRLAVVGGAGSLLVAEGGPRALDLPQFPDEYRDEALELAEVLEDLRATDATCKWFFVSPADVFGSWVPGEATGSYRVGGDLSLAVDGPTEISGADFALAFVDEIEQNRHNRTRISVAH